MSSTVNLGEVVKREGKDARCVRITHQTSLFESVEGKLEVVEEHLLEFKHEDGYIDFDVLSHSESIYTGPLSIIKAPEPINWKRE